MNSRDLTTCLMSKGLTMNSPYKVIVVTADARNARLIRDRLSATANILADVITEEQLHNGSLNLDSNSYNAVILSTAIGEQWELRKDLLTGGKNIPVLKITESTESKESVLNIIETLETRVSDLAERQNLSKALRQRDGEVRNIIEKCTDCILVIDEDGKLLYMNPAATAFFQNKLELNEDFGYPAVSGDITEIDLLNLKGDRSIAEMRVTEIQWSGKPACLAILRDVTERKLNEEMLERKVEERTSALEAVTTQLLKMYRVSEQAVQMRSQFIANVSHEIRTPLSGIVSGAELLCQAPDTQTTEELAPMIFKSAKNLLALVNEILDFAKIERGEFTISDNKFSVSEMLNDVKTQMAPLAEQKNLQLDLELSPALEPLYTGDQVKVRQILTNLIHNALKFTEKGNVTIKAVPYDDMFLQFSISDSGIGIEESELNLIFQPFVQGGKATGRQPGGTGLGLSICSQLAKALNGSLTCQSEYGKGSTFILRIPIKKEQV